MQARIKQYPLAQQPETWLVTGGRGSGKTRLGAEWTTGLARGLPPFTRPGRRYGLIALVGETLGDVREVMIEGASGIMTVARRSDRPRFEATRRRLVWPSGAVAQMFSSEDPDSLRGPQFEAAWCDELGCPAVDKGPNQPNVFSDPKSAEGMLPYFSSGGRADIAQARFLEAHAGRWDSEHDDFEEEANPISPVYGGRMVDAARSYVWAWDARPFPAFPMRSDTWSDHGNWHAGHWLNGRIGNPGVGDLVNAILADHGLPPAKVDGADGTVVGYVIDSPTSARAAIEPITELFGLSVIETDDGLVFKGDGYQAAGSFEMPNLVVADDEPIIERVRTPDHQLPVEVVLNFQDPLAQYQIASVRITRSWTEGSRQHTIGFPGSLEAGQGRALAGDWLRRIWNERETIRFALSSPNADILPGAVVRLSQLGDADYLVTQIEDGLQRTVLAKRLERAAPTPWMRVGPAEMSVAPLAVGQPHVLFLDLPSNTASAAPNDQFRIAAWRKPWKSQAVYASPETTGFAQRATILQAARLGTLVEDLPPGVCGRIDRSAAIVIELASGEMSSISRIQLLNGDNSAAIRSTSGAWELVQFETAEETAPNIWRLSGLLRAQLGTDDAMRAGSVAGADFVLLDDTVRPAGLLASEAGLLLNWRVGPAGADLSEDNFFQDAETGGLRALLPLSPVHLTGAVSGGDLALTWIRRGRVDADSWNSSEIALGEDHEEYEVAMSAPDGPVLRTKRVTAPSAVYTAAEMLADFGLSPAAIDITVRQLSIAVGLGIAATCRFNVA